MRLKNILSIFALFLLFLAPLASVSAAGDSTVIAYSFWEDSSGRTNTIFNGDSTKFVFGARTLLGSEVPMYMNLHIEGDNGHRLDLVRIREVRGGKQGSYEWELTPQQYDGPGTYTITTTVTGNSGAVAKDTLTLIVKDTTEGNTRPAIDTLPTRTVAEHKTYLEQISAADADNDPLTFTLDQAPEGMTIDNNGLIQWVAPEVDGERLFAVTVRVSDGKDFALMTYTLKVTDASSTVIAYSFWNKEDGRVLNIYNGADAEFVAGARTSDSNELPMTGKVELLDQNGNIIHTERFDPGSKKQYSRLIRLTQKDYGSKGRYVVRTTVTGNSGAVSTDELILIVKNTAPSVDVISAQSVTEGEVMAVPITAVDAEGDQLTYDIYDRSALPGAYISGNTLYFQPGFDFVSHPDTSYTIVKAGITVSDGESTVSRVFWVTVNDKNRNPSITTASLPDGKEGSPYHASLQSDDADGDALSFEILSGPSGLSISSTGQLSWNDPVPGTYAVNVKVSDAYSGFSSRGFSLFIEKKIVPPKNRLPVFDSTADQVVSAGNTLEFTVRAVDPDGDKLIMGLTGQPAGSTLLDNGDGTALFRWTPTKDQIGEYTLTFHADDGKGESTLSVKISVIPVEVNLPPVVSSIEDQEILLGDTFTYQVAASDPENDPLTYSLTVAPTGMTISDSGVISWKPADAGTYTVEVSVSDGIHSVAERFVVKVTEKNVAPGNPVITEEGLRFESVRLLNGDEMAAGEPLVLSVKVSNYGDIDYKNLKLTALVIDTGDYKRSRLFSLDAGKSDDVGLVMDLPYLIPGEYDLRIVVSSDDVKHVLHRQFTVR